MNKNIKKVLRGKKCKLPFLIIDQKLNFSKCTKHTKSKQFSGIIK